MVQPKNKPNKVEELRAMAEEYNKQNPIIDYRYYVIEVTPAYNTGGYYDQDIPEKRVKVSPYFVSQSDAISWLNDHEPDEGNKLKVQQEALRQITFTRWEIRK